MAASLSYITSLVDTANQTTYTFTDVSIGTPAADRRVIVVAAGRAASNLTLSSASIGGVAATVISGISDNNHTGIAIALVPTGATATISITWSGQSARMGAAVYVAYGLESSTPFSTATGTRNEATQVLDLETPAGGIVVAGAAYDAGSGTPSWTGATKDEDIRVLESGNNHTLSVASAVGVVAETPRQVRCAISVANVIEVSVAASWAPALPKAARKMMHYRRLRI